MAARLDERLPGFFDVDVEAEAARKLRRATSTGRPLGAAAWVKALEASCGRALAEPPRGRPRTEPAMRAHLAPGTLALF